MKRGHTPEQIVRSSRASSTNTPMKRWRWALTRHCSAEDLITELERLVAVRTTELPARRQPPELIADALRDWCRLSRIGISYIDPGAPWENPGRKRQLPSPRRTAHIEEFGSLLEAQGVIDAWRIEYNTDRPHGALGGLTPTEVRAAWITENQPALS